MTEVFEYPTVKPDDQEVVLIDWDGEWWHCRFCPAGYDSFITMENGNELNPGQLFPDRFDWVRVPSIRIKDVNQKENE